MFGTGHPRPLHRKEVPMHVLRQEQRRHAQKPMRMRRIGLVMYERGAMPIPFRCMDRAQEAAFRRLAAKVHEA